MSVKTFSMAGESGKSTAKRIAKDAAITATRRKEIKSEAHIIGTTLEGQKGKKEK